MHIDKGKKLSIFAEKLVPSHVRENYPNFVIFIQKFLEYIERDLGEYDLITHLREYADIDNTVDGFLSEFRAEYADFFPQTLATDLRLLLKNIRQFYRSKGTEDSYEFLFRAVFDTYVDFYYPKEDILRASDGRWVEPTFLFTADPLSPFFDKDILGQTSGATGYVQSSQIVINPFGGGDEIGLRVLGVDGTFIAGEVVQIKNDPSTTFTLNNPNHLYASGGEWLDDRGKLSWNKYLQDNRYYQEFSYQITSDIGIQEYKKIIDDSIHPAGMKLFAVVTYEQYQVADLPVITSIVRWLIEWFNLETIVVDSSANSFMNLKMPIVQRQGRRRFDFEYFENNRDTDRSISTPYLIESLRDVQIDEFDLRHGNYSMLVFVDGIKTLIDDFTVERDLITFNLGAPTSNAKIDIVHLNPITYLPQIEAGDNSTTIFNLNHTTTIMPLVFVDGVKTRVDLISAGTQIEFATAPINLAVIEIYHLEDNNITKHPIEYQELAGDGTSVDFVLTNIHEIDGRNKQQYRAIVTVDGVKKVAGHDYFISGDTLTFKVAPSNLSEIDVHVLLDPDHYPNEVKYGDGTTDTWQVQRINEQFKYVPLGWAGLTPINQPPSIVIDSPLPAAEFIVGDNITISMTATDSDGIVVSVEVFYGVISLGFATNTIGDTWELTTNTIPAGNHFISAVAIDDFGDDTTSPAVNIVVNAQQVPVVSIDQPNDLDAFLTIDNITLVATATDADGTITQVQFFYNGTNLIGTATPIGGDQYQFLWNNPIPAGVLSITAKATDNHTNVTTSSAISITVNTALAPVTTLLAPLDTLVQNEADPFDIVARSYDPDGGTIEQMDFYRSGVTLMGTRYRDYSTDLIQRLSPRGYYKLDEASGTTLNDSSGNANNGNYYNSSLLNQAKVIPFNDSGSSVYFDSATTDYAKANVGTVNTALGLSFEAWFNISNLSGNRTIFGLDGAPGAGSDDSRLGFVVKSDGTLRFYFWDPALNWYTLETNSGIISASTTYHIVVIFDASTGYVSLYVNGELIPITSWWKNSVQQGSTSVTLYSQGFVDWNTSTDFYIANARQASGGFAGSAAGFIDEAAFYNVALSHRDILENYYRGITDFNNAADYDAQVLALTPEAYYKMGGLTSTVADSSGNGYDLTIQGINTDRGSPIAGNSDGQSLECSLGGDAATGGAKGSTNVFSGLTFPVTLEAWIQLQDTGNHQIICSTNYGTAEYRGFWMTMQSNKAIVAYWGDGTGGVAPGDLRGSYFFNAYEWGEVAHFTAVFVNTTTVLIYKNGRLLATTPYGTATVLNTSAGVPTIGTTAIASSGAFQGKIDSVAIYNAQLTQPQIEANFLAGLAERWAIFDQFLGAGSYAITAKGTDDEAQTGTSSANNITLDSALQLTLDTPTNALTVDDADLLDFKATASDAGGTIDKVEFLYDTSNLIDTVYRKYDVSLLDRLNPLVYYKLDETSGTTIVDSSGNGNNGVISGAYTLNQPSLVQNSDSGSLSLNSPAQGSNASVTGPSLGVMDFPVTLECWFEPTDLDGTPALFPLISTHFEENDYNGFNLYAHYTAGITAMVGGGSGVIDVPNRKNFQYNYTFELGKKYHIVAVFRNINLMDIYVNSVKLTNPTISGSFAGTPSTAVGTLTVGKFDTSSLASNRWYGIGKYDEVAVYTIELSDKDILENYYRGRMDYNIAEDYPTRVLSLAPKAYYKLDEVSGTTMVDSSGNALNGSFVNSPVLNQKGLVLNSGDKSVLFETANTSYGTSSIGTFNSAAAWTMEAWFKPYDLAANRSIIQIKNTAAGPVTTFGIMSLTDGSIRLWWYASGEILTFVVSAAGAVTVGSENHLVATHDGSNNVKLYINNRLVASGVTNAVDWNAATTFYAGVLYNQSDILDQYQNGFIDEVAIYTSQLTEEQIATNYLIGLKHRWYSENKSLPQGTTSIEAKATDESLNTANDIHTITVNAADIYKVNVMADIPQAYWRLGEDSGSVVFDSSGNDYHGDLTGDYTLNQADIVSGSADGCIQFNPTLTNGGVKLYKTPIYSMLGNTYDGDFVVEFWIKPTAWGATGSGVIYKELEQGISLGMQILLLYNTGVPAEQGLFRIQVNHNGGVLYIDSATPLILNNIYYITYKNLFSTNRREIWINGVLDSWNDGGLGTYVGGVPNTSDIGNRSVDYGSAFKGYLDELAIYKG